MAGTDTVIAALRQIPLFAGLSEEQLSPLVPHILHQQFPRGQTLFNRGERGDRAYVIVSGSIDLVIESPDGRELILARLGPGEHFGEMALMDDLDRSASARTAAPTEVVVVLREAFLSALRQQPEVAQQIIRSLIQRLRAADEKIEAFAYLDAEGRVARVLLDMSASNSGTLHLSHEELAHMSGTSRQTTTRILDDWRESGYVELSRRDIRIQDAGALSMLARL